jgi:arsenite methyltransferase
MVELIRETIDIRTAVRKRYAAAARAVAERRSPGEPNLEGATSSCCSPAVPRSDASGEQVFGRALYGSGEAETVPDTAIAASLGCGVPTAIADLKEGETVLDLGSGAGADVLISARRVGPTGKAIGLDMTDEMLALARSNAQQADVENAEFHKGYIEAIPLRDGSVDVVISNCVLNLSGDKPQVLREVARVLRPGGRLAISDVIADEDMDAATRADMQQWTGCIAGALTRQQFTKALSDAGLTDIEIRETHRVHSQASSAMIRARKPHR